MNELTLVDTHTHMYDEQYIPDTDSLVEKAIQVGVKMMLMPNCDVQTIEPMLALADKYPNNCLPMIGLHPIYVGENYEEQLNKMYPLLSQRKFVAVGEVGLDFYRDKTFAEQQQKAFEMQIGWAEEYDLPLVIHTRASIREGIDTLKRFQKGQLRGVFHCFSGTLDEAKEIILDLGFKIGVGGVLTFKNSNLKDIVRALDVKDILLETDAPYLAPTPYRGKRNDSSYIPLIAEFMADVLEQPLAEIARITTENAKQLFNLEI